MRRILFKTFILVAALVATVVGAAFAADPGIRVTYLDGGIQVRLDGSYAGATYTVFRTGTPAGDYTAVTGSELLCLGECLVQDTETVPGQTYQYRFDLFLPTGQFVSYGPYAVQIPERPLRAAVSPNPGGGFSRVELSVPGGSRETPVEADARILDLQGRSVKLLLHGTLARGITSLSWNGRGDGGQRLPAGVYYLRFTSALGRSTTRLVRL